MAIISVYPSSTPVRSNMIIQLVFLLALVSTSCEFSCIFHIIIIQLQPYQICATYLWRQGCVRPTYLGYPPNKWNSHFQLWIRHQKGKLCEVHLRRLRWQWKSLWDNGTVYFQVLFQLIQWTVPPLSMFSVRDQESFLNHIFLVPDSHYLIKQWLFYPNSSSWLKWAWKTFLNLFFPLLSIHPT